MSEQKTANETATERPAAKSSAESHTEISELMMPGHANFGGNVHGGVLLALLDRVAYIAASKHSDHYCVTASVDRVDFYDGIKVGEILHLFARVNYVGRSSMEVGIRVQAENIITGENRHTNSCYFTMVAMGSDRRPVLVPELLLETPEEKKRFAEARERADVRKETARH